MVRRVLQAVYREVNGLHEAAYVLAVLTVGSQLLALIRDRLLAHEFGAGVELDLYYAAFRIPDVLYVLFASMLSVYVLIPFIAERVNGTDSSRARNLLSQLFTLFLIAYGAIALGLSLCADTLAPLLFPGLVEHQAQLVLVMRILLLQPFFLGISSLCGVITQFGSRFVLYALSPLLYNLGIIVGLVWLYPVYGISGLAYGVVLGALGHLVIQLPYIRQSDFAPHLVWPLDRGAIREVLAISVPRTLTLSLHQLVLLGLVGIASVMTVGSVSVFQFALNLQSVPLAIIGVSYSVAAFPLFARLFSEGNLVAFGQQVVNAIQHILFWSLPIVALMVVIRAQFVRVIFGTGAFDWNDTRLTAAVLALFILSLAAQAIHLLVVRALYAAGNTRLPFYITVASSFLALFFSIAFYTGLTTIPEFRVFLETLFRVNDVPGSEVLALPLGYSLALIMHVCALLLLSRRQLSFHLTPLIMPLMRACTAALAAGTVSYYALNLLVIGLKTDTFLGIFLQGFCAGVAGIVGALCAYAFLGSPELGEIYRSIHARMFKTKVVMPQEDEQLVV